MTPIEATKVTQAVRDILNTALQANPLNDAQSVHLWYQIFASVESDLGELRAVILSHERDDQGRAQLQATVPDLVARPDTPAP